MSTKNSHSKPAPLPPLCTLSEKKKILAALKRAALSGDSAAALLLLAAPTIGNGVQGWAPNAVFIGGNGVFQNRGTSGCADWRHLEEADE